ncbi:MAG TPA: polyprenyl synthetase family protein, partial [Candidatus Moranbacteria bacterium]|nr:polyprenyl synthetase family protein [Candidatus Moranbacteria bacterium]
IFEGMTKLSVPMGIAFQIQDDILGIFGSEEKIGKPIGSDISEGKQTILVLEAKKNSNEKQKRFLNSVLGKSDLSAQEVDKFRDIVVKTGALDYAKNLAKKYIAESKKEIAKISLEKKAKDFLMGIADYMMEREV